MRPFQVPEISHSGAKGAHSGAREEKVLEKERLLILAPVQIDSVTDLSSCFLGKSLFAELSRDRKKLTVQFFWQVPAIMELIAGLIVLQNPHHQKVSL